MSASVAGVITPAAELLTIGNETTCTRFFSPALSTNCNLTPVESADGVIVMSVTAPEDEVFTSRTFSIISRSIRPTSPAVFDSGSTLVRMVSANDISFSYVSAILRSYKIVNIISNAPRYRHLQLSRVAV